MCTVTWLHRGDSYRLFCNRDELRSRRPALSPRLHEHDQGRFLAPVDGEAGGTWIAVNEHGLTLCLLNDYRSPAPPRNREFTSRGLLVRSMASASNLDEVLGTWASLALDAYRPFTLLVLEPANQPCTLHWNSKKDMVRRQGAEPPLSSSSFDDRWAEAVRRELFASQIPAANPATTGEQLLAFHRGHLPERGPFSVCMHRTDASTVSFSLIGVGPDSVSFAYAPGPPCETPLGNPMVLRRS